MHLLIVCFVLLFALNAWADSNVCGRDTFQNAKGNCCDYCAKGEYVKSNCSKSSSITKCGTCEAGQYQNTINPYEQCHTCLTCHTPNNSVKHACTATTNTLCSCLDGYECSDVLCSTCEVRRPCQLGEELQREGSIEFSYKCVPCPEKTFSDSHNGICKPQTQCSDNGFTAIFPGNKTHNSRCALHGAAGDSTKEVVKTVVIALALSILLLLILYACVKKTMKKQHENGIARITPVFSENTDYPYPKEETTMFSVCQDESKDCTDAFQVFRNI